MANTHKIHAAVHTAAEATKNHRVLRSAGCIGGNQSINVLMKAIAGSNRQRPLCLFSFEGGDHLTAVQTTTYARVVYRGASPTTTNQCCSSPALSTPLQDLCNWQESLLAAHTTDRRRKTMDMDAVSHDMISYGVDTYTYEYTVP